MRIFPICSSALAVALAGCGGSGSDAPDGVAPPGAADGEPSLTLDDGGPEEGGPGDGSGPTAGDTAIITADSYEAILRRVIAIANDEALDAAADEAAPLFAIVQGLLDRADADGAAGGDGLVPLSRESAAEGGPILDFTFSCDGGGTLVARAVEDAAGGGPRLDRITLEGTCVVAGDGYAGVAFRPFRLAPGTDVETYEDFSITRADGRSLSLDGDYSDTTPEGRGPRILFGWSDADLVVDEGGSTTRIDGYRSRRESVDGFFVGGDDEPVFSVGLPEGGRAPVARIPHDADADVSFSVAAPWSADTRLEVVLDLSLADGGLGFVPLAIDGLEPAPDFPLADLGTPLTLTNVATGQERVVDDLSVDGDRQWQTGSLSVTAADGSSLVLSPETGDPATFAVTIGGATDPIVRAWSDGFQVSCPQPIDCR